MEQSCRKTNCLCPLNNCTWIFHKQIRNLVTRKKLPFMVLRSSTLSIAVNVQKPKWMVLWGYTHLLILHFYKLINVHKNFIHVYMLLGKGNNAVLLLSEPIFCLLKISIISSDIRIKELKVSLCSSSNIKGSSEKTSRSHWIGKQLQHIVSN